MNASELVERLAERLGVTEKAARQHLEAALAEVTLALARGERVALSGFGTFELRERAGRSVRHPADGERLAIPDSRAVVFRPGAELRRAVEGQTSPPPVV